MKVPAQQETSKSRALDTNTKQSRQPSLDVVIQAYKDSLGNRGSVNGPVIQRFYIIPPAGQPIPGNLGELIAKQRGDAAAIKAPAGAAAGAAAMPSYTTVGFEHEFAQMPKDSPLDGVTHAELSRTTAPTGLISDLPFIVETDADNAIELVSPPLIVETVSPDAIIPHPNAVATANHLIEKTLKESILSKETLAGAIGKIGAVIGIPFSPPKAEIVSSNINPDTRSEALAATPQQIAGISLSPSKKRGGKAGIGAQVNFATDAVTYDLLKRIGPLPGKADPLIEQVLAKLSEDIFKLLSGADYKKLPHSNQDVYFHELARHLSQVATVPSIKLVEQTKRALWSTLKAEAPPGEHILAPEHYNVHTGIRSHVKDVYDVWLKSNIFNFGLGLLDGPQWDHINAILTDGSFIAKVSGMVKGAIATIPEVKPYMADIGAEIDLQMQMSVEKIAEAIPLVKARTGFDAPKVEFGGHTDGLLGARHDTHISQESLRGSLRSFPDRVIHVVEARADDPVKQIYDLLLAKTIFEKKHATKDEVKMAIVITELKDTYTIVMKPKDVSDMAKKLNLVPK